MKSRTAFLLLCLVFSVLIAIAAPAQEPDFRRNVQDSRFKIQKLSAQTRHGGWTVLEGPQTASQAAEHKAKIANLKSQARHHLLDLAVVAAYQADAAGIYTLPRPGRTAWVFPGMLGISLAVNWTAGKLDRRGHSRWAKALRIGAASNGAAFAVWNFTRPGAPLPPSGHRPSPGRGPGPGK